METSRAKEDLASSQDSLLPPSTPEEDDQLRGLPTSQSFIVPGFDSKPPYGNDTTRKSGGEGDLQTDGGSITGNGCSWRNYIGIFFTLGSGFNYTVAGIIVKCMQDFHPFTLALFRFQGILLPGLILVLFSQYVKKEAVFSTLWPLTIREHLIKFLFTVVRGILGGSALILLFFAIQRMTLADAMVITSCRPVFVTFVAHVFLGEPCGIFPVIAALLTIVGVGVISRPPLLTGEDSFDHDHLMGALYAFIGMLTAAGSMVILRYLRDIHFSVITLAFGIWGTIISGIGSAIIQRFDTPSTPQEISLAFGLAGVTFLAEVGITLAMKYEQAGSVAILRSVDTIYAFILQYFVLGVVPDKYSSIGAILIVFCVILIAFRKWISTLPEKHPARTRFWFVLK